jgi:hypothetical protein
VRPQHHRRCAAGCCAVWMVCMHAPARELHRAVGLAVLNRSTVAHSLHTAHGGPHVRAAGATSPTHQGRVLPVRTRGVSLSSSSSHVAAEALVHIRGWAVTLRGGGCRGADQRQTGHGGRAGDSHHHPLTGSQPHAGKGAGQTNSAGMDFQYARACCVPLVAMSTHAPKP